MLLNMLRPVRFYMCLPSLGGYRIPYEKGISSCQLCLPFVRKCSHKYGIEIPTSITHAKRINQKNGNTFWTDAILKEMKNVGIAFTILDMGKKAPPDWTKASGNLVFDARMSSTMTYRSINAA